MITVVGIGFESGDITLRGRKAIKSADVVVSRAKNRKASVVFAEMFSDCESYDQLDQKIADYVIAQSESGKSVVFLSVGDGYGDTAVKLISKTHPVTVIAGVADTRARNMDGSFATYSAYDVDQTTVIDSSLSTLIYQIDDRFIAGDVKLALMRFYAEDTRVTLCSGKSKSVIALEDMDRVKIAQGSSVFIEGIKSFTDKKRFGFGDLLAIMRALTAPDGCPWDKEQTHESICIDMLEEAYEAVDALQRGDVADSIEELGDVILQAVFHSDIAMREGEYDVYDVLTGLCQKLVSRHTHIFGENKASNTDEALFYWDKAKAKEKSYCSFKDQINRLPDSFPGALLLEKLVKKANKNGASITEDMLVKKISDNLNKSDRESVATLISSAIMLSAIRGQDAEALMVSKFAQLKDKCDSQNLTEALVEQL